jgi:hypothetical protein
VKDLENLRELNFQYIDLGANGIHLVLDGVHLRINLGIQRGQVISAALYFAENLVRRSVLGHLTRVGSEHIEAAPGTKVVLLEHRDHLLLNRLRRRMVDDQRHHRRF